MGGPSKRKFSWKPKRKCICLKCKYSQQSDIFSSQLNRKQKRIYNLNVNFELKTTEIVKTKCREKEPHHTQTHREYNCRRGGRLRTFISHGTAKVNICAKSPHYFILIWSAGEKEETTTKKKNTHSSGVQWKSAERKLPAKSLREDKDSENISGGWREKKNKNSEGVEIRSNRQSERENSRKKIKCGRMQTKTKYQNILSTSLCI